MKYIIVGLGSFGSSLAEKLTAQGNEVIGIDSSMTKVELLKEKISHTICMNASDELAVGGLPLNDTDIVIVAIGENQGANIMTTALFKNFQVKRLISRAIDPLHEKVLLAIGVDEIVHPEEETAERWAKKLCFINVVDSYELSDDYSIIEIEIPKKFIGKTILEIELRSKYSLLALTTIKKTEVKSIVGKIRKEDRVQGVASSDTVLNENDILVIYGSNKDLRNFITESIR
ncbi:trk system potassium uptake protein TrkA [Flavobacteriaceae bacterium MAR_2010_188]|nr:trk system potassium uptake protein TrkA [Flavobacteriaceae bacterium MAR_2010_188]